MLPRARATVERMSGYQPGEQPAPDQKVIKLNTNENPFPPSPRVMAAIRDVEGEVLRRYPNPTADAFRTAAAHRHGISQSMVLAGNGSDDILRIALGTFCGPGDTLAYPHPTYSLYPVLAEIGDVVVSEVPWRSGWTLPTKALLATGARAIFFANPNAPSGTVVPPEAVRNLAQQFDGIVLVDEAYADFADSNCLALTSELDNVIISRTLSKSYSLAGLRFGYAIAAPAVIEQMAKIKDSYNCDAISIAAACAAIRDQAYARRTWDFVRSERQRLTGELDRRGWLTIPSQANFLLTTCPGGNAAAAYRALKTAGILVRYFDRPGLADKLRITVGTREDNDALLAALP